MPRGLYDGITVLGKLHVGNSSTRQESEQAAYNLGNAAQTFRMTDINCKFPDSETLCVRADMSLNLGFVRVGVSLPKALWAPVVEVLRICGTAHAATK